MEDLTGRKFNELIVLGKHKEFGKPTNWLCKCVCGKEIIATTQHLKNGQHSCGCKTKEILSKARTIHGKSNSRLYDVWHRMKERCYRKKHKSYADYGGRGIKVCDEWKNDYTKFEEWALSHGYDESAEFMKCTLDRIDVNGDYEPDNCRFVDMKTQCKNRRNNRWIEFNGQIRTMSEWSEITGISQDTLQRRIDVLNWSIERALTTKVREQKNGRKNGTK